MFKYLKKNFGRNWWLAAHVAGLFKMFIFMGLLFIGLIYIKFIRNYF